MPVVCMTMKMPKIMDCEAKDCAYNKESSCHAIAITVGGGDCPLCDTSINSAKKGGIPDMVGSVGACKEMSCQFNKSLECTANEIDVKMHSGHAECGTYKSM